MNSLSWMLYAADVIGNVQGLMIGFSAVAGSVIAFRSVGSAILADAGDVPAGQWLRDLRHLWIMGVFAVIAAIIPSTQTIYLIAASEAGQAVATSPDGQAILNDTVRLIRQKLAAELTEGAK